MSTAYAPVPTIMPATITLPQDLVDQRSAASVNVPFATLANAVAYLMLSGSTDRSRSCTSDLVMGAVPKPKGETMVGPPSVAAAEILDASTAVLYADHLRFNIVNDTAANGLHVYFPINSILIDGAKVTSAKVVLQGGPGHGALPLMMPAFSIVRVKALANTQVGMLAAGMTDDASAGVGAYEAIHTIEVIPDQNETIDFADHAQYYAVFCNEGNTNAVAELKLYGITIRMTAPRYRR